MNFPDLPIVEIIEEVNQKLASFGILIVTAPPGAGKSTVLPLSLYENFGKEGKILMLEPRRIAARQVAERMAMLLGEPVGKTVGYRIRHESKVSAATRIEVLTEGVLTRMLIDDPALEGVSLVIFDEVHERSLQSDLAMALVRETRKLLRPDLHLLLMSATIDTLSLSDALAQDSPNGIVPVVSSKGRLYPVEIIRNEMPVHLAIASALRNHVGDILVFLPGEYEIKNLAERLERSLPETILVCPLYSNLPLPQQRIALAPAPENTRKIVLATSIAETSLTIQGIRVVIDSGLCRHAIVDPRTGLSHLQTTQISLDMADQRAGRAGRLEDGVCYRLWSLATEHRMEAVREPEVLHADLASLYLSVLGFGISDPKQLTWLTPPVEGHLLAARSLLDSLGAIDEQGQLTNRGKRMTCMSYHPRLANMLLAANTPEEKKEAISLADLIEERKPLPNYAGKWIIHAFPDRVVAGNSVHLSEDDPLYGEPWIVAISMDNKSGRIYSATAVTEEEMLPYIHERHVIRYDVKNRQLIAQNERRVGNCCISSAPIGNLNSCKEEAYKAIAEAAQKNGLSMFDWSDDVDMLQQRISFLSMLHPELDIPIVSQETVFACASEWLPLYLPSLTSPTTKVSLREVILGMLSYEQQQALDRLAPTHLVVPTGSRIRLEYRSGAEFPVLRVRLQECFGLLDTPTIDDGRCPVLLELLSPGFKPVQLTRDLRSFWETTYFEVRKELRRRYPKHSWPDNPITELPTRGVKHSTH